jgi:hypothetical protein
LLLPHLLCFIILSCSILKMQIFSLFWSFLGFVKLH